MVAVEPDRPRQAQLERLFQERMAWPDDRSPRLSDEGLDGFIHETYPDVPWELIDARF
jgi:hypothetical protein